MADGSENNELPILKKQADDLEGLPVLKKKAESLSAQSTTPSNQPLVNAPTTTTGPLIPTNQEQVSPQPIIPPYAPQNLQSQSQSGLGTSDLAPSTLAVRQKSNADRIDALKDKTRQIFLANPVFSDDNPNVVKNKEIYFNSLKKNGYSDKEIGDLRAYSEYVVSSKRNYDQASKELAKYQAKPEMSPDLEHPENVDPEFLAAADAQQNALAAEANQNLGPEKTGPVPTSLTYNMATAALGMGKYDEAINFFTQTLGNIQKSDTGQRIVPQGEMSMNIQTEYNAGDNPSNSLYGIGNAMTKLGRYEDAIPYFIDAVKADPANSDAQKGLAYAKYKLGDRKEYKEHLKEAAAIDESLAPGKALAQQIKLEGDEEKEQQRRSEEVAGYADMIEAFATGDREGKLGNIGLLNPIGKMIAGIQMGTETAAKGVKEISQGDVVGGGADVLSGTAHVVFSVIPQVQAFNTVVGAVNETAKQTLPEEGAKLVEDTLNLPFTAATTIASALGYDPKEGSTGEKILGLADIIASFGAMHAAGAASEKIKSATGEVVKDINSVAERITSIEDLKNIVKDAAAGKLSEKEMSELKEVKDAMSEITPKDILEEAAKNPELKKDIDKAMDVGHKSAEAVALEGKLDDLKKAIENPEISPETKAEYQASIDEIQAKLTDMNNTETTDHVVAAETEIKVNEIQDRIDILNQDMKKAETQTEKDIIQKNIATLESEKNEMVSAIQPVENMKENDVKAVSNPGTPEFYELAESALEDAGVVARVKASLEEAATAGELTPEEAQAHLDAFKERVQIQEVINPGIKGMENRMSAADLIEKKNEMEARLKELKSYIPPVPEATIAAKERAIENVNTKLNELLKKSKEDEKFRKETQAETSEVLNEDNGGAEPPPASEKAITMDESPEEKVHAIWKRVLGEMKDRELAEGIEEEGVRYLVKKDAISESSARDIVNAAKESGTLAELERVVLDDSNKMDPVTRGVTSAMLGKEYFDLAEAETDPIKKDQHMKDFFKYTDKAASLATEGGQMGNAIGKVIKKMYASNPETVVSQINEYIRKGNEEALVGKEEQITQTYESIKKILETPEGQAAVTEQIAKQSERLFGKETQKKITDLFDKAKIDTKGKVFDASIGLPVAVYNGAVEAMKQAALLGAKGADIIAEGVRHIRENHKEEWDDAVFKKEWEKDLKDSGVKFGKKRSVTPKEEASILDAIEKKAGRLKKENRDKFLKDIVQEVEKEGGLDEQRFKGLYAEALGLQTMTPELIETIRGYSRIINEGVTAENKYLKALDTLIDAEREGEKTKIYEAKLSKESAFKEMLIASLKAKKANSELSNMMKENKKLSDTLIGMMQLGALTPASIIKNISAMPAELAFRALSGHLQGAADYLLSGLANVGLAPEAWKERQVNSIARMQGAWYAHPEAVKNLFDTLLHGSFDEQFQSREVHNKIEPVRAFQNLVSGKSNKDMSAMAANFMEALPQGYIAAGMGRALAGPDAFFRTVGEMAKAYELGKLEGKDGADLEKFMFDPPKEAAEQIAKAGDEITFQQDNIISEYMKGGADRVKRFVEKREGKFGETNLGKATKGALKVIAKSQALYIKTPTNVFGSVLRMVSPEYSALRAIGSLWKGDKVAFSKYMADVAVGSALRYVIVNAIKHNMVTPTIQYNSKEGKAQGDETLKHGGKFNRSAFTRMLSGGDWHEQDDDVWVDYSKWTGGLGVAMGAYASMLDGMPKEDMSYMTAVKNSYKVLPTMGQQVLDLSFMSTTSQLIDALKDSEGNAAKKWTVSTVGTLATPILPNTVTTTIKASSDTKKSTYSPDMIQNIINDFKYKLTGGGDLPSKITLWGEPIATAPKGSNKYMYYLFNVVRAENPDENSVGYKTMELYRKTGDKRVIPTQPSNQITIGDEKVTLDGKQFEQLQRNIGSIRKNLVQDYMNNGSYNHDDDNARAYKLDRLYSQGHKTGIQMTIDSDSHLTSIKNDESESSPVTGNKKPRQKRKQRVRPNR